MLRYLSREQKSIYVNFFKSFQQEKKMKEMLRLEFKLHGYNSLKSAAGRILTKGSKLHHNTNIIVLSLL